MVCAAQPAAGGDADRESRWRWPFAAAIAGLRQHSTPYHLAHGLLDHAAHLLHTGGHEAAAAATGEAAGIRQPRANPPP
jgi:hypothetical protein